MKTVIVICILFISCTTIYKNKPIGYSVWILNNHEKLVSGMIIHRFISLDGNFGNDIKFDSLICKDGDTIMIKQVRNMFYLLK
jgi:hypothetical protein